MKRRRQTALRKDVQVLSHLATETSPVERNSGWTDAKRLSIAIAIVFLFIGAALSPELIASQCIYNEVDHVSCTTGDCQCVFQTPDGQAACTGYVPSWIRGDLGDARTRCKGTGGLYQQNLIDHGCGKMWGQYTNCVWAFGACGCPNRNEVLDVPVMYDPINQFQRAKTDCIECVP